MEKSTPFIPEKIYHVYTHAVENENLFRQRENYNYFLTKYREYIPQVVDTFAYCLLPNHFHFLIRVKSENEIMNFLKHKHATKGEEDLSKKVSQQFSHLLNGYSQAYNKMFKRRGTLFMSRIKRKEINDDHYFSRAIGYVHVNPIKHRFVKDYSAWEFSSYSQYIGEENHFILKEEGLSWFGGKKQFIQFHEAFKEEFMNLDQVLE